MNIRSVNFFGNDYCSGGSTLSEDTKAKLISMGIDPSDVTSEAQAQLIIETIMQQKILEASNKQFHNNCSDEREVISRIKSLANKIGLTLSSNIPPKEMIEALSAKISTLISTDTKNTNQNKLYRQELNDIINNFNLSENNRISIYNSMIYNANVNRYILGL